MKKIVMALGGNALQRRGEPPTDEAMLRVIRESMEHVADVIEAGYQVILAHGNGPQVGRILLQNEYSKEITPAMPLDVCVAMSQGMIGYHMQQALGKVLASRGSEQQAAMILTRMEVSRDDPAFQNPSKPIGPFYTEAEARTLIAEKGYVMKEDAGRGWRRVVPSPMPLHIVDLPAVRCMVAGGFITIAVGGGGVPMVRDDEGWLQGVAAVIDKDLASERLAEDVDADTLMILTDVEKVCIHYKKPEQQDVSRMSVTEAERYMAEGHFAPGSMLPKIEAAVRFVKSAPGRTAIVTSLDMLGEAVAGRTGTLIYNDPQ